MNKQSISKYVFTTLFVIFFGGLVLQAQTNIIDVLYLKNGNIITGRITQRTPDQSIWIKTTKGSLLFKEDEIQKVRKESDPLTIESNPSKNNEFAPPPPPPPPETDDEIRRRKIFNEQQTQKVVNTSPNNSLSAENLYMEYFFDCFYFLKKYDNKIISVSGKVISADSTGSWELDSIGNSKRIEASFNVFLQGGNIHTANEIVCFFDESQGGSIATLFKGKNITIKGMFRKNSDNPKSKCECSRLDFQLLHCVINN